MKTIGIVAEGLRDYELISAVIDTITNEENSFQCIQPEQNAAGQFGNGWRGVWSWCEKKRGKLNTYMHSLSPVLDLLVVHIDGDVYRNEKEFHCSCQRISCDEPQDTHPLFCRKIKKAECPVVLPCRKHESTPEAAANFLREFVAAKLLPEDGIAVSYMIPYDATDTWIVAAFDEYNDYEALPDPWNHIIARSPEYHGIKIKNRPNKAKITYQKMISKVCENWDSVVEKCPQAKRFDEDVRRFLMDNVAEVQ